ncbi:hypothetical protein ACH4T9_13070 [Micromonospora sp. NPDC020750]
MTELRCNGYGCAITALGRRIRAEVKRIYLAGRADAGAGRAEASP